jgi:hypothetical protein
VLVVQETNKQIGLRELSYLERGSKFILIASEALRSPGRERFEPLSLDDGTFCKAPELRRGLTDSITVVLTL